MQPNIKNNYFVLYQPQEIPLPSGWKETTLGEVCSKIGSGATPRGGQDSYKEKGVALIRSQNVLDLDFTYSGLAFIDKEQADDLANVEVQKEDVLINITGDSVARVCMVPDEVLPARVNQHVSILRANCAELNPYYLKYYLVNQSIKQFLLIMASSGATRNALTKGQLENFPILLPPPPEQKAISTILSLFDDKIELLRRQNKTLEQIAQAIFKEWFVKFTVNSKKLKINKQTGLPEGWRMGNLPDIFEISPVRNLKKGELAPYLDMKGMPTQGHYAEEWYNREFTSGSKFANGDTLLARITPCLENGKTAFVDFLEEEQVGWGSTEFIVLHPKPPYPPFYGYLLARSNTFRNFAIGQMTGSSGRQRVPEDCFESFNIAIPPNNVLILFSELIDPFVKRLKINAKQIQTLSKLRDILLPKLMKGEIRVKDTEPFIKEKIK
jgi:type I restriction enzyme S subunit